MAKIIHLLDNDTINKIAAGEVIENPKSIVKELVENSIDAGADEIIIEIKNGGKSLIRITDNGKGINRDEIEDAFKRHCTSKITSSEDLEALFTLGFRGEALASIAAVSHVEVITRTVEEQYGIKLIIEGGNVVAGEDIGCPVGTTISVTELFYNVPARKKFLKSDMSESSNINEIVVYLALSRENISFKYVNNNNIIFKTPKTSNFINTISSLYDRDLYNSLLEVNYQSSIIKITGFITNLNYYRGNRKNQLIFVNNRFIKHKRINYYIEAAYYSLLPKNKYPACFLKLDIEPSAVDVNVHPAKTEVRFQNEELVLEEVKKSIYKTLKSFNIIKEIKKETIIPDAAEEKNSLYEKSIFENSNSSDTIQSKILYTEITISEDSVKEREYNSNNIFDSAIAECENEEKIEEFVILEAKSDKKILINDDNNINKINSENTVLAIDNKQQSFFKDEADEVCKLKSNNIPELYVAGIVMDTYIICENKTHSEMYMIDQHAAHERINYERFLKQYNEKEILRQEMLTPEVINLSYNDFFIASENKDIFDSLGLAVDSFGNNAIIISSIPVVFCNSNIKDIFFTILDTLKDSKKFNLNLEIDKIIKNACVKSVKSGDKLHLPEVQKLLEDLRNTDNPYTCPHGRPVIIKLTKYEIERMFERIQN